MNLTAKLKRRKSTFVAFSPKNQVRSKNNNALIIEIASLHNSLNKIMASLHEELGKDIIAAKQHFRKGLRTHLEI
ncbi:24325_t:CDS:1, partial [Cetraspora pellucida]